MFDNQVTFIVVNLILTHQIHVQSYIRLKMSCEKNIKYVYVYRAIRINGIYTL